MKQMEVIEKQIGEHMFYIRPFPAFVASNISGELASVVVPIIGSIAPIFAGSAKEGSNGDLDINIMDVDIETAAPGLANAFSGLSGDQFEALMKKLLVKHNNISVEGPATEGKVMQMDIDLANEVFCGELQDMYALCFEVIKLNFSGFFKKLGTRFGDLQQVLKRIPSSPNTANSTQAASQNSN